jgi:hypothetical protein
MKADDEEGEGKPMTSVKCRTAALLLAALMAMAGVFAVSATFAAEDAHATFPIGIDRDAE